MKTILLAVNAYAGSVSPRVREVIVKALQADFKVEVADTAARNHAIDLAHDAAERGFDAVLVFGGDGTINEVVQSLAGTSTALGILPGGTTNVMARSLGVPRNPVEATAFVASHLRSGTRRRINLGIINQRYFLFSAGMGLDAEVVKRVEADPAARRRNGEWVWARHALAAGITRYMNKPPTISVEVDGYEAERAGLVVCCNGRPFSYFKQFPVDVCPEARLDEGLDVFGLKKIRPPTVARIVWAVFISRSHVSWRNAFYRHDTTGATLATEDALPVQVDGDYLGDWQDARIELVPDALDVLV